MKSPPIGIHPTWFDEKSGRDARCCAAVPLVSAAPTRPVRMQWPRNLDLEVNLNILLLLAFTPSQKCSLYHPSASCPRNDTPPRRAAGTPSSRASTSFLLGASKQNVDGRDEPGHDSGGMVPRRRNAT